MYLMYLVYLMYPMRLMHLMLRPGRRAGSRRSEVAPIEPGDSGRDRAAGHDVRSGRGGSREAAGPASAVMPTYRMLVAYDGGPFRGFARQPGLTTVQGEIEGALSRVLREPVTTSAAGRTDAGVHALGQVMSFRRTEAIDDSTHVLRAVNAMAGQAIAVLALEPARDGFDARFSAVARTYEYMILTRPVHDPFSRHTVWHHPGRLDLEAMRQAGSALLGEHDFRSFARVEEGQMPIRRIEALEVTSEGDLVVVRVRANSFLQQMVRSIVGTLVKAGEGKLPADGMGAVLEAHDRSAAGPVAPPHGLFLVSVDYPEELV
jgi:tRNA pseudouridine38-40 synthase